MPTEIPLSRGLVTIVDDEDAAWLGRHKWSAQAARGGRFYAIRGYGILMHRLILQPPEGFHCDHIDNDGLNNQRSNLRLVTRCENAQNARRKSRNSTGYKGVSFDGHRFVAQICANRQPRRLGRFKTAEEAYEAYCRAAAELHGEFARLA